MTFEEFEKEARKILRLQDKKQVDIFLSLGEEMLGFYEWSDDEIQDRVEGHLKESRSGGVPWDMAYKSARELELSLIIKKHDLIPAHAYKKSNSLEVQEQKRALRYLKELVRLQTKRKVEGLCLNLDHVQKSIEFIEESLKVNQVMNTGGHPTTLSDQDLSKLVNLKILYNVCFPENPKTYKSGGPLTKLGEALIEKSIPRNIDKLVGKALDYTRNYEE
jgi:hypothetical protein